MGRENWSPGRLVFISRRDAHIVYSKHFRSNLPSSTGCLQKYTKKWCMASLCLKNPPINTGARQFQLSFSIVWVGGGRMYWKLAHTFGSLLGPRFRRPVDWNSAPNKIGAKIFHRRHFLHKQWCATIFLWQSEIHLHCTFKENLVVNRRRMSPPQLKPHVSQQSQWKCSVSNNSFKCNATTHALLC